MNTSVKKIGLIFPHQLFEYHKLTTDCDEFYLIEDSLFFGDPHTSLSFHRHKCVFHRASMRAYADELSKQKIPFTYLEYQKGTTIRNDKRLGEHHHYYVIDPTDYLLEKRLKERFNNLSILPSPLFINSREDNKNYMEDRDQYFMHHFYQWQRKRLGILVDKDGNPEGGSWSYDDQNRKKIPQKELSRIPEEPNNQLNSYIEEAQHYVAEKFPHAYGSTDVSFIYPVTRKDAQRWFNEFLTERFEHFGPYEDAMVEGRTLLYHSLLSPLLNVGLLDPQEIVSQALDFASDNNVPLNSLEGFIRQVIGWREFIRLVYEFEGTKLRTHNQWNHERLLPKTYWTAETGIDPIDETIKRVLSTGYAHHIERLMLFGNFMFLQEANPDHVYRWFMEMFIDSYDWVMVPNVYGMTQNTCKGLMTTKPYISGSNYILKMSNHKKGDWTKIWDALYWSFVIRHREELENNGRMFFVTKRASGFTKETQKSYEAIKETFYRSQE